MLRFVSDAEVSGAHAPPQLHHAPAARRHGQRHTSGATRARDVRPVAAPAISPAVCGCRDGATRRKLSSQRTTTCTAIQQMGGEPTCTRASAWLHNVVHSVLPGYRGHQRDEDVLDGPGMHSEGLNAGVARRAGISTPAEKRAWRCSGREGHWRWPCYQCATPGP